VIPDDVDIVIDSTSIATADVPYVTAGPNAQYEAQADKIVRIRRKREYKFSTKKWAKCTSKLPGGSESPQCLSFGKLRVFFDYLTCNFIYLVFFTL
jgi:hypothetical protein